MFDLACKTVLITGASAGIGSACAEMISGLGARVVLAGRNCERLAAVRSRLAGDGHMTICQELTDFDALPAMIDQVVQETGPVCGFVHAAGIETLLPLKNMRPNAYADLFSINVTAGFEIARLLTRKKNSLPHGGSFVFIASVMALAGQSGLIGYCSSKGALIAGARAMAVELVPRKIRVNCICPGIVEGTAMTEQLFNVLGSEAAERVIAAHPMGLGKPQDVAGTCAFLLSDAARWMTGTALPVDGGYTMV